MSFVESFLVPAIDSDLSRKSQLLKCNSLGLPPLYRLLKAAVLMAQGSVSDLSDLVAQFLQREHDIRQRGEILDLRMAQPHPYGVVEAERMLLLAELEDLARQADRVGLGWFVGHRVWS